MELLRLLTSSFFVVILFINCSFPEKNCKNFKTGSFEFKSTIDGKDYVSKFIRGDSLEIEFFNGIVDTSSVRWVSDCEFILKNINPKKSKKSISMKILSTTNESYVFEYSIIGDNSNRKRGTAYLLDQNSN